MKENEKVYLLRKIKNVSHLFIFGTFIYAFTIGIKLPLWFKITICTLVFVAYLIDNYFAIKEYNHCCTTK